ncbi:MAG: amino acid adenylation domain-containing protein [Methylococcales bacterium]
MNILSEFLETCLRQPGSPALIQDQRSISYRELMRQIRNVSGILSLQSGDARPVAVALDRGIEAVVVLLAVLHSGRYYLPLDLKNPRERLEMIIQDAQSSLVIGNGSRPCWVKEPAKWIEFEKLELPSASDKPPVDLDVESLACILYTSGSTGKPKGVALSHRALKNFSRWAGNTFAIGDDDRIASLAPLHFDLSIFDLFSGLSRGACIHFVPEHLTMSPARLSRWLMEKRITVWYTVPSLLNFLALKGALETTPLKYLKTLLFAGEVMPPATLIKLTRTLPETRFYNLFGPTECNVCCYWPVEREELACDRPVPIGRAACGLQLAISESTGELLVRGDNLFSGYWSQGRLIDPVKPNDWYATGDRVSLAADGNYRYHGRIDRMLKCSGYRVEPAEIESMIRNLPIMEACAVVGIDDPTSGQRPAAAVVLQPGKGLNDLLPAIKASLPVYMQPVKYLLLNQLPRLSNGKPDYSGIERELGSR